MNSILKLLLKATGHNTISLRWMCSLIFVLVTFICLYLFFNPPGIEPQFDGKNLSFYLNDLKLFGPVNESPRKLTEEALIAIGSDCLPHLKKRLNAEDSFILPFFTLLDEKFPLGEAPRIIALPAWVQKRQALRAIPTIGHSAHNLIPDLISMLSDSELCYEAAWCLGAIGTKSIDPLVDFLSGRPRNSQARASAIYALGQMSHKKSIQKALKVLISSLEDSSDEVQKQSLIAMRKMHVDEKYWKNVTSLIDDENPTIRREAQLTIDHWMSLNPKESL